MTVYMNPTHDWEQHPTLRVYRCRACGGTFPLARVFNGGLTEDEWRARESDCPKMEVRRGAA